MSTSTDAARAKARERSVGHLQRVYGIVVSLAIATSLKALFGDMVGPQGEIQLTAHSAHLFRFWSFIVTVVPFFHGANRYLDMTYVTQERKIPKFRFALLVDFLALFIEAIFIFCLAMFATCQRSDQNRPLRVG